MKIVVGRANVAKRERKESKVDAGSEEHTRAM